ncbi:hypothetical protein ACHAXH_004161, partial [Discostella pseudostelligera]
KFSSDDDNTEQESRGGQDFPAWLKALLKWDTSDQSPSPSPSATIEQDEVGGGSPLDILKFAVGGNRRSATIQNGWEDEMSPVVASLSGMINVEALMAAANETDEGMDLLLPNMNDLKTAIDISDANGTVAEEEASSTATLFPFLDNALRWEDFAKNFQQLSDLVLDDNKGMNVTFEELVNMVPNDELVINDEAIGSASSSILKDATKRLEFLINATSSVFTPSAFQSLILRASNALAIQEASGNLTSAAYAIFEQAGKAPIATAEYTAELVKFANAVLVGGYAPLFSNYPSATSIPIEEQQQKVIKGAEFATLSGAIYENTILKTHIVEHSILAQGKTADIGWMVTDSIQYEEDFWPDGSGPTLVRTFVIRGYDASDEEVDREGLLNNVCTASPVVLQQNDMSLIKVHKGMLAMAEKLLQELQSYIDLTSPSHKFVFTGHSIGGSLAILLSILLANDRGSDFVRRRVLRVFTYGSPPIFEIESISKVKVNSIGGSNACPVLDAFDLPTDFVYSYNQPWDPIVRLFSQYDPLYPLIDDLGEDGYTPWVSGPSRTLRPILKTILESWEGWPRFRANARGIGQNYRSVGVQYLLLPDPARYLTDRLVSVNTQVPEIDTIIQISSNEVLPALNDVFTLDTFTISYVSVAVRSFIHHFYPAYGAPVVDYAEKISPEE